MFNKAFIILIFSTNLYALEIVYDKSIEVHYRSSEIKRPVLWGHGIEKRRGKYYLIYHVQVGYRKRFHEIIESYRIAFPKKVSVTRKGNSLYLHNPANKKTYRLAETSFLRGPIKWTLTSNVTSDHKLLKKGDDYFLSLKTLTLRNGAP